MNRQPSPLTRRRVLLAGAGTAAAQGDAGPVSDGMFVDFRWSAQRMADSGRLAEHGTCGTAFRLPGLRRAQNEPAARFEVHAVHELFTISAPATTQLPW